MATPNNEKKQKPPRISYAAWYLQRQREKREAAAKATAEGAAPPVDETDHDTLRGIADELGRQLSKSEVILERLSRDGDEGKPYDRLRGWTPPMHDANKGLPEAERELLAEIAEYEREQKDKEYAALTTDEARVHFDAKRRLDEMRAQRKTAEEYAAWRNEPAVKAAIDRLRDLDDATAFSPAWDWSDTVAIAKALAALETDGVDKEAALQLFTDVTAIDKAKRLNARTTIEKQIDDLRARVDSANAELVALGYVESPKPDQLQNPPAKVPPVDESNLTDVQKAERLQQQSEDKLRRFQLQTALIDAARPGAHNEDAAKVIADHLLKSAKWDASGAPMIEFTVGNNGSAIKELLTPAEAVKRMESDSAFGKMFKVTVPASLPVMNNAPTVRPSIMNAKTSNEILEAAKSDPELAEVVAAAQK